MSEPAAFAVPPPVTTCSSSGPGSLRFSVLNAADGDTIDLSSLPDLGCSTITLTTGAIVIAQQNLTITGPDARVTITGKDAMGKIETDRIFDHEGTGTLHLDHLDIEYGNSYTSDGSRPHGGCIYSKGSVFLLQSSVTGCRADGYGSLGGGLYVAGDLTLRSTAITSNAAARGYPGIALGGGAYVRGQVDAKYSSISGNFSINNAGGLFVLQGGSIVSSTISGNAAYLNYGGLVFYGASPASASVTITNSTISGNRARYGIVGGMIANIPVTLQNVTIAFNSAHDGKVADQYRAVGLVFDSSKGSFTSTLQSSLLSNNTYGSIENDFSTISAVPNSLELVGADNLIRVSSNLSLPNRTTTVVCPLLGPLRDNGGTTLTHALLSHSPAMDTGNDSAGVPFDQRGSPRISPVGGSADIGAYEVDQDDIVFNAGFDGCP